MDPGAPRVEIFGRNPLQIEKIVGVIRNLPRPPLETTVELNPNNIYQLLKPNNSSQKRIKRATSSELIEFILNDEIRSALLNANLSFGKQANYRGFVNIFLRVGSHGEIFADKYESLDQKLLRREASGFELVASVENVSTHRSKLDPRLITYSKILVAQIMPEYTENGFIIVDCIKNEPRLLEKKKFLNQYKEYNP